MNAQSRSGKVIRQLCARWGKSAGVRTGSAEQPSFADFYHWVQSEHPEYLQFRPTMSVREDVEHWFDQEFGQNWRN